MTGTSIRAALLAAVLGVSVGAALAQTAASAPAAAPAASAAAPKADAGAQTGKIAWYGKKFAGRRTASGEAFNPEAMTMAHNTLPFGTRVKVTNVANGKSVTLRVNDRGPTQPDRIADVSQAAARKLGFTRSGLTEARLEVVGEAPPKKK